MSAPSDSAPPPSRKNPLIWIAIAVALLILFLVVGGERGLSRIDPAPEQVPEQAEDSAGTIERSLLVPPGMRARQYIEQLRAAGGPYPLQEIHAKALSYSSEGSLADAHLLYFFAAREDHLPSILMMAEMSDPTRFRAQDSLLDYADVIQAYKWYQRAADLGDETSLARVEELQTWARDAAGDGDPQARQLLLNYQ